MSYVSFGCYYCDALFGNFYLTGEKLNSLYDSSNISINLNINFQKAIKNSHSHWCYSENRDFCQ